MKQVPLIRLEDCRENGGTFVEHDGLELAVFRLAGDTIHVIDNACPHASGNLSGGEVVDGVVSCPWHFWQFNLATGVCIDSEQAKVKTFEANVVDGWVVVEL